MKKILIGIIMTAILIVPYFWDKWVEILNVKIGILFLVAAFASYYQADYHPFKVNNADVDKGSVLHIIWTVYLTQFFSFYEAFVIHYPRSLELSVWSYLFIVIAFLGLWFRSWAYLTLGKFFTMHLETQSNHKLIENGPYKYLRHPSYTGALVTYVFLPLFLNSYYSAFATTIFLSWALIRRILLEEKMLMQKMGTDYERFCQTRYRLIPFVW